MKRIPKQSGMHSRHVYLVEIGREAHPLVFGTRSRARKKIKRQGDYRLDPKTADRRVEFWDNPNDLDDQCTIYRVPVQ